MDDSSILRRRGLQVRISSLLKTGAEIKVQYIKIQLGAIDSLKTNWTYFEDSKISIWLCLVLWTLNQNSQTHLPHYIFK